jgi:hypothetical protein
MGATFQVGPSAARSSLGLYVSLRVSPKKKSGPATTPSPKRISLLLVFGMFLDTIINDEP